MIMPTTHKVKIINGTGIIKRSSIPSVHSSKSFVPFNIFLKKSEVSNDKWTSGEEWCRHVEEHIAFLFLFFWSEGRHSIEILFYIFQAHSRDAHPRPLSKGLIGPEAHIIHHQ